MIPLRRFEIHQPASVRDAARMVREFGEDGCFYSGGTELLLAMKHDVSRYRHLVDVKVIPGLDGIEMSGGAIHIGATTTHRTIERSELVRAQIPVFAELESRVANVRVRATGTLGGNLCFAEPHSDPATLLLVLGASVVAEGPEGRRELPMTELTVGAYSTSLASDEVLTGIEIPVPNRQQRAAYLKFQVHERPTLGIALLLETPDAGQTFIGARVAVGCVSPFPRRSATAEELLRGSRAEVERNLPESAGALADDAELMDDSEGAADYKRHLIVVFLRRAFQKALGEAGVRRA
jgi:aerobic carbon-monoxide dehydrogenase medium subunit